MVGSQGSIISNLVGSPGSNIAGIVSNIEEKGSLDSIKFYILA